ncbi:MAG: FMN-binding protein [Clostridia bacterium]
MRKVSVLIVCLALLLALPASAQELTGTAKGFGGDVTVCITVENDKITQMTCEGASETSGVGSMAIEQLPAAIIAAGGIEGVDCVAGATVTSTAIFDAVKYALNPETVPAAEPEAPEVMPDADLYRGMAMVSNGRIGPGKDDKDVSVYSFNIVSASGIFDREGRIVDLNVDMIEVATPNYDGADMPHLSGFPGQGGYNYDENHDEVVDGKTPDTEEAFLGEVAGWKTKRERGDSYKLNSGTWAQEMDSFEQLFKGMTVEEVTQWFKTNCSDLNGRPLKAGSDKPEDAAKYDALTDEQKTALADVVSGATISIQDAHGDILGAITRAYENRAPLVIG